MDLADYAELTNGKFIEDKITQGRLFDHKILFFAIA